MRKLLAKVEESPAGMPVFFDASSKDFNGHSHAEVCEHVLLLIEAGLAEGRVERRAYGEPYTAEIVRLTHAGHDFIAQAHNVQAWSRAKKQLAARGVSVSLAVFQTLLAKATQQLACLDE
jgi:hypothetical protein